MQCFSMQFNDISPPSPDGKFGVDPPHDIRTRYPRFFIFFDDWRGRNLQTPSKKMGGLFVFQMEVKSITQSDSAFFFRVCHLNWPWTVSSSLHSLPPILNLSVAAVWVVKKRRLLLYIQSEHVLCSWWGGLKTQLLVWGTALPRSAQTGNKPISSEICLSLSR